MSHTLLAASKSAEAAISFISGCESVSHAARSAFPACAESTASSRLPIEKKGYTETDAHRLIEKRAMDTRMSRGEVAQEILEEEEEE